MTVCQKVGNGQRAMAIRAWNSGVGLPVLLAELALLPVPAGRGVAEPAAIGGRQLDAGDLAHPQRDRNQSLHQPGDK